jgi:hypothetical protein
MVLTLDDLKLSTVSLAVNLIKVPQWLKTIGQQVLDSTRSMLS